MAHAPTNHDPHDSIHYEHDLDEHDSWFRHAADEPHHQSAHGATRGGVIIGFMLGTLAIVLVVSAVVYYSIYEPLVRREVEQKHELRTVHLTTQFVSMHADWQARLRAYEWADPAAGRVRIPLDAARKRVIDEYARSRKP